VVVTHSNAVHYALSLRRRLGLQKTQPPCLAHVTTPAADLGHTSWLLALATGGSVHVIPDDRTRDPGGDEQILVLECAGRGTLPEKAPDTRPRSDSYDPARWRHLQR
jgi:hypothetical protein